MNQKKTNEVEATFIKTYTKIDNRFKQERITYIFKGSNDNENYLRTFPNIRDTRAGQVKFVSSMINCRIPNEVIYFDKNFSNLVEKQKNKKFILTLEPASNPKYINIVSIKPCNDDDYKTESKAINDDDYKPDCLKREYKKTNPEDVIFIEPEQTYSEKIEPAYFENLEIEIPDLDIKIPDLEDFQMPSKTKGA